MAVRTVLLLSILFIGLSVCTNGEDNFPDYNVISLNLPLSEGIISPGGIIHPVVRIRNEGFNDSNQTGIQINGYLNDTPLVFVTGKINPLKSGQEEYFPITFQIPGDIEYGKYKFYVVVDPGRNTRDNNIKK